MSKAKEQNRHYYYSTYSSDIYAEAQHNAEDINTRKQDGKYVKSNRHWSLNFLFNTRMAIIAISVIISSILFSSQVNKDPKAGKVQVSRVLAPPHILDIKELQIPSVSNVVTGRIIFTDFLANLKSEKIAKKFSGSNIFYQDLKLKRDRKKFESRDSVLVYLDTKNPEAGNQWLNGYISFINEITINKFIKLAEKKIDGKKDNIAFEVYAINKERESGNNDLINKIKKYTISYKKAIKKGIVNSISAKDIPEEGRFGDLLYLQGSWKLESEIKRLNIILKKQVIDISSQQDELTRLSSVIPNSDNLKSFILERKMDDKDLESQGSKQLVWSVIGGLIGLFFGLIISYPFRRKKAR